MGPFDIGAEAGSRARMAPAGIVVPLLDQNGRIEWDCARGRRAVVTLLGTGRTIVASNFLHGVEYVLWVLQDGTGNRTITTYTGFDHGASGAQTLTTTASRADMLVYEGFRYPGTQGTHRLRFKSITKAFS